MVVRGSLGVTAVLAHLRLRFLQQHFAPAIGPARGGREFWQRAPADVEREGFSREMRVGAEVEREIALHVRQLLRDREERVNHPGRLVTMVVLCDGGEEGQRPEPGEHADRQFEHARPIGARQRRVGVEPAAELRSKGIVVDAAAGERERTPEGEPVLMPVELPDHLVIAEGRVKIRHRSPVDPRHATAVDGIAMPVDRESDADVAMPEERVPTRCDLACPACRVVGCAGKVRRDSCGESGDVAWIEREGRRAFREMPCECAVRRVMIAARHGLPREIPVRSIRHVTHVCSQLPAIPARRRQCESGALAQFAQLAAQPKRRLRAIHRHESAENASSHAVPGAGIGRRIGHASIERQPLSADRVPAIPFRVPLRTRGERADQIRLAQQPDYLRTCSLVVVAVDQQAVNFVRHDCRNAAHVGGDDRTAAGERFEHGGWHVVDIRRLQVDVGFRVVTPDLLRWHPSDEANPIAQSELRRKQPAAMRRSIRRRRG